MDRLQPPSGRDRRASPAPGGLRSTDRLIRARRLRAYSGGMHAASSPVPAPRSGHVTDEHGEAPEVTVGMTVGVPTPTLLGALRIVLHTAFAGLLALGLVRALTGGVDGPVPWGGAAGMLVVLTAALAAVYLAGTVHERRLRGAGRAPAGGPALGWLAAVLALWALLVLHHADFTWLAFPLFFVSLHVVGVLLRRPAAAVALVAAVTGVVVLAGALRAGALSPGAVLGPAIGAGAAVVMHLAYRVLLTEAEHQRIVADQLRATRAELAESERHAGVLAERERLSREIHDTLTQGLASIVLVSRAAQDAVRRGDLALADERLETVRATAAENLAESRAFVRGLRAPADGQGEEDGVGVVPGGAPDALAASLAQAVRGFRARQQALGRPVDAELTVVGQPVPVGEAVETVLVRAAQASLANVAQHARARRCRVTLTWLPGEVALDIADDGDGFDPVGVAARGVGPGTGVGLAGLRERVAGVGGQVDVETAPREGTVVAVRVPVAGLDRGRTDEKRGRA